MPEPLTPERLPFEKHRLTTQTNKDGFNAAAQIIGKLEREIEQLQAENARFTAELAEARREALEDAKAIVMANEQEVLAMANGAEGIVAAGATLFILRCIATDLSNLIGRETEEAEQEVTQ